MNADDGDSRLGLSEYFRTLREHDRATAASFDEILARRPRKASHGFPRPAWAALACAAIIFFWFGSMRQTAAPEPPPVNFGTWRSPTGFLLEGFGGNFNYANWRSPTIALAPPLTRERDSR